MKKKTGIGKSSNTAAVIIFALAEAAALQVYIYNLYFVFDSLLRVVGSEIYFCGFYFVFKVL